MIFWNLYQTQKYHIPNLEIPGIFSYNWKQTLVWTTQRHINNDREWCRSNLSINWAFKDSVTFFHWEQILTKLHLYEMLRFRHRFTTPHTENACDLSSIQHFPPLKLKSPVSRIRSNKEWGQAVIANFDV